MKQRLYHVEPLRKQVVCSNANGYLSFCLGFEHRGSAVFSATTIRRRAKAPQVHLKHLALHNLPGGGFLYSLSAAVPPSWIL
uniref:Uncharacterized protein n=1 Tax=Trichogramma kaykai TaxID=54128 RepID=A0ABD2VY50_9HYME